MELEKTKAIFRDLVAQGRHQEIIDLLTQLLSNQDLSEDDKGWALWNICDRYALKRDANAQYNFHSEFYEWVRTHGFHSRLHWVVSDGTQAMTLIDGGLESFWTECYDFANSNCIVNAENRNVRFESHRAAVTAYLKFGQLNLAEAALDAMEKTIAEEHSWDNHDFAIGIFRTLLVEYYHAAGITMKVDNTLELLKRQITNWVSQLSDSEITNSSNDYLLGSWDQLNSNRPKAGMFTVIHNAACTLARLRHFQLAEDLFAVLVANGRKLTAYAEAQHLLASWESRRDKDEIANRLRISTRLNQRTLQRYVPELADMIKGQHPDLA